MRVYSSGAVHGVALPFPALDTCSPAPPPNISGLPVTSREVTEAPLVLCTSDSDLDKFGVCGCLSSGVHVDLCPEIGTLR